MEKPSRHFYVYEHRRASDGTVFYVGKGAGVRAWNKSRRSARWKNTEAKHGRTVHLIYEGLTEQDAFNLESSIIAAYGREFLKNLSDGGEGLAGWKASDETRAKMSASSMGQKPSEETLAKLRGRKLSDEAREKISQRQIGPLNHMWGKCTPAMQEAARERFKGIPKTRDHAAKIGAGRKAFNGTITLSHSDHGTVTDYQVDLCRKYGLSSAKVSNLNTGKRKTHKGWTLAPQGE